SSPPVLLRRTDYPLEPFRLGARIFLGFGNDVARPLSGLAQYPADIFADDAEDEQLCGPEQSERRHDRGPACDGALHEQEAHDRIDDEQDAEDGKTERQPDGEPQRPYAVG